MKIKLEIDDEQLDSIVRQDLKKIISVFESDMKKVKSSKKGFVFHLDYKKDLLLISEKLEAFKKVLDYYEPIKK